MEYFYIFLFCMRPNNFLVIVLVRTSPGSWILGFLCLFLEWRGKKKVGNDQPVMFQMVEAELSSHAMRSRTVGDAVNSDALGTSRTLYGI